MAELPRRLCTAPILRLVIALSLFTFAASASAADTDGDLVDDAVDNCVIVKNPSASPDVATFLAANPWATLTGGQRDDDADGVGNKCDADFDAPLVCGVCAGYVSLVLANDLAEMMASMGKNRTTDTCGVSGTRPCAIFDLDESGGSIGQPDLLRFNVLYNDTGSPPMNTSSGPQGCAAGTSGTCSCPSCK
jgi:hypothetical protein